MTQKDKIADFSYRVGEIAYLILTQLDKRRFALRERFFVGMLERQATVLRDIHIILNKRTDLSITSASILFRCLLDDFILLLHVMETDQPKITFNEQKIIDFISKSYGDRFKMYKESRATNEKYFGGKHPDLATSAHIDKEEKEFRGDPQNAIYLVDGKFAKMKSTKDIVDDFPVNDISRNNAHAFVVWKYLSGYVHYSIYEYQTKRNEEATKTEFNQLQEALTYCYKSILISSRALNDFGIANSFIDKTKVQEEIFAAIS